MFAERNVQDYEFEDKKEEIKDFFKFWMRERSGTFAASAFSSAIFFDFSDFRTAASWFSLALRRGRGSSALTAEGNE